MTSTIKYSYQAVFLAAVLHLLMFGGSVHATSADLSKFDPASLTRETFSFDIFTSEMLRSHKFNGASPVLKDIEETLNRLFKPGDSVRSFVDFFGDQSRKPGVEAMLRDMLPRKLFLCQWLRKRTHSQCQYPFTIRHEVAHKYYQTKSELSKKNTEQSYIGMQHMIWIYVVDLHIDDNKN